MSYDVEVPLILKFLTGDTNESSQIYTDDQLIELFLVATQLLKFDIALPTIYTVDLDNLSISPDPTLSPRDDTFITLCCLKASIVLLVGETNKSTSQAIQVRDGLSLVDLRSISSSKLSLLKTLQDQFKQSKLEYLTTGTATLGRMIVSPFRLASTPYGYNGYFPTNNGHDGY